MKTFNLVFDDKNDGKIILHIQADNAISAIRKEAFEGDKDTETIDDKSLLNAICSYNILFEKEIETGYNATLLKVYEKKLRRVTSIA